MSAHVLVSSPAAGSSSVTVADLELAIGSWRADYDRRRAELLELLAVELTAGRHVLEIRGNTVKDWYPGSGPFLEPYNSDPRYLAEHLQNRHFGFGWILELGGRRYELGKPVQS